MCWHWLNPIGVGLGGFTVYSSDSLRSFWQSLASPAMGHWGTCPLLDFQLFIFFWSLQSRTNSDIRLHVVAYPVKLLLVSCPPRTKSWRHQCRQLTWYLLPGSMGRFFCIKLKVWRQRSLTRSEQRHLKSGAGEKWLESDRVNTAPMNQNWMKQIMNITLYWNINRHAAVKHDAQWELKGLEKLKANKAKKYWERTNIQYFGHVTHKSAGQLALIALANDIE